MADSKKDRIIATINGIGIVSGCVTSGDTVRCLNCGWEAAKDKNFINKSTKQFRSSSHMQKSKWKLKVTSEGKYEIQFLSPQLPLESYMFLIQRLMIQKMCLLEKWQTMNNVRAMLMSAHHLNLKPPVNNVVKDLSELE